MDAGPNEKNRSLIHRLLIRADEIDAGTSILSLGQSPPLSALSSTDGAPRPSPAARPTLRREGSAPPPPPSQPPPAPPSQLDNVTDSLSLPQLKQLVGQFPKIEQRAYAFQYSDVESYPDEVDEWFHYTEPEQDREYLLLAREMFEQRWKDFMQRDEDDPTDDATWISVETQTRKRFVSSVTVDVSSEDVNVRQEALGCLYYILTGVWSITSGLERPNSPSSPSEQDQLDLDRQDSVQVEWMHKGADVIIESEAINAVCECLRRALAVAPEEPVATNGEETSESVFDETEYRELSLCFSTIYMAVESARSRLSTVANRRLRKSLQSSKPDFLVFLVSTISRLRWDESYNIPLMHALQLLWKCILLVFGDTLKELEDVKSVVQPVEPFSAEAAHPVLTASPLDYHLFRQEITSKYPSYNPPLPLVPLEIEHKSMLPPLPHQTSHSDTSAGRGRSIPNVGAQGSILHQPVHIATPAPSPPPSPVGPGGKAGKKQNYQTNQNFPFLYPPLDNSSNSIGGKGSTELQDLVAGKQWEGSDIPASIIEAGELFASRMRMTRAMRQLWKERDLFMKYDRGWRGTSTASAVAISDPQDQTQIATSNAALPDAEEDEAKFTDADLKDRLDAVERFFHHALPDLQSLVIVMMKVMLTNVQDIAVRNGAFQDGSQGGGLNRTKSNPNMTQNQALPMPPAPPRPSELSLEDLDNIRSREISQKAISSAVFLLLKWFKVSHVLKSEYMTQLLLDSNFVQLTLKYFAHQNLEDLIAFRYDRDELGFFHYCHLHSDHPPLSPTSPDEHSETSSLDEAIPPPIQRHRRSPTSNSDGTPGIVASPPQMDPSNAFGDLQDPRDARPSVDELGNPLVPLPTSPITEFSFRQFQTSIHLLRVLQKVTRAKAHRILLLVQFKSSQILRRLLRVPDPMLRLYVLKLFKSQVPYCGRKWRQSNMRVITAIYLHCRPELRDEWLAGMHDSNVEGEVDEAVPLEWALRGLTYWWQKRMYSDVMQSRAKDGAEDGGQEIEDEERDFFQRELDDMGWGMAALGVGEDVAFGEEAAGANGAPNGEYWEHQSNANMENWQ